MLIYSALQQAEPQFGYGYASSLAHFHRRFPPSSTAQTITNSIPSAASTPRHYPNTTHPGDRDRAPAGALWAAFIEAQTRFYIRADQHRRQTIMESAHPTLERSPSRGAGSVPADQGRAAGARRLGTRTATPQHAPGVPLCHAADAVPSAGRRGRPRAGA